MERILQRLDWRFLAVTICVALVVNVWSSFEVTYGGELGAAAPEAYLSTLVTNLIMAMAIGFATVVVDEAFVADVSRKRFAAYAAAVVAGAGAGALLQWQVHEALHLESRYHVVDPAGEVIRAQPVFVFFEYLIWGAVIVVVYVNHRGSLQAAARLRQVQIDRAATQRRAVEMRLQALQARVEPEFLFGSLARVRDLYAERPEQASSLLDDLIAYLRAALPSTRRTMSTLGQEIGLVEAYLRVTRAQSSEPVELTAALQPAASSGPIPAMVLLPLVSQVLRGSTTSPVDARRLRITARRDPGRLRIEIDRPPRGVAALDATFEGIRQRLGLLYGDAGRL
ncbi:MAG TPA: histidine kinase, partial [Steroidobacteraceae bacterium]|nr:histidine kinase [Steroidobacteraceae bacterium]